uniref:Probable imidazolonepropionase n=1 Tax=Panagrolaimus davidi TaxID=227884 RepID=A0A914Q504_9BILA
MNDIKIIGSETKDLAVIVVDGIIKDIGRLRDLEAKHDLSTSPRYDCGGGCLLPGLVDGHSHPVFAGDRVHEFAMKLAGATYMEVQAAGGGIHFTTTKTREASKAALVSDFKKIADQMLKFGTTTLEAKSGYGLNWETELKMLEAIEDVSADHPLEISGTFCGAHAVPKGKNEDEQCREIVDKMIPKLRQIKREGQLKSLENIDVFCEKGVFEIETSKEILTAGKAAGFHINFHADELNPLGGAEMGASIGARAMSHLEEISSNGISEMVSSGTVATLLPSTAYMLRLKPPPAREMIENGVIVALGSGTKITPSSA